MIKKGIKVILSFLLIACILPQISYASIDSGGEHKINQSNTKSADGYYYWKIDSKTLVKANHYGTYKTVGSATVKPKDAPQDVTATGSRTYSHGVSGTVKVSKKVLEQSVGFSYSFSKTESISITKRRAPAGTYLAKSRGVYKRYKVKQQRYYRIDGYTMKVGSPVYCYVNKYQYEDHCLTKK